MEECPLYGDPQFYDLLFPPGKSAGAESFYIEESHRCGGRVLEMACGSGRLTIPIANSGVDIVGADLSPSMLAAARAKSASVTFLEADMRRFDLGERFSAVLIPGNSLLHLHTIEELKQCLEGVRRHLLPGGRLIFDVSKWDLARIAHDKPERYAVMQLQHPERGPIAIEETSRYDAARQVRHIRWYVSAAGAPDYSVIDYHLRVIFPQELLLLLEHTGFRLEQRYGEFPREPFHSASPRQVCICTPY